MVFNSKSYEFLVIIMATERLSCLALKQLLKLFHNGRLNIGRKVVFLVPWYVANLSFFQLQSSITGHTSLMTTIIFCIHRPSNSFVVIIDGTIVHTTFMRHFRTLLPLYADQRSSTTLSAKVYFMFRSFHIGLYRS